MTDAWQALGDRRSRGEVALAGRGKGREVQWAEGLGTQWHLRSPASYLSCRGKVQLCSSVSLLSGERLSIGRGFQKSGWGKFSHPERPDFWKPQPVGGVVSFFPVQWKCGFLGNVCLERCVWD